jgi:hypothetical protein
VEKKILLETVAKRTLYNMYVSEEEGDEIGGQSMEIELHDK